MKPRRAALALALCTSPVAAHGAHAAGVEGLGINDLTIMVIISLLLVLFAWGWRRMPARRSGGKAVESWRAAAFVGALLILAIVLLPPFDELADTRFSAHMAQHLVLLVVAPPLLAASQGHLVLLQALPLRLRRRVGRAIARTPGLRFAAHHSSTVAFVCLSSVAVLWFWHMPAIYDFARRHEAVHDLEHLFFLLTELAFWRVILFRAERQLSRAAAALILVAMSAQGGLLAAIITLAGRPMYATYSGGSEALSDQALGGVMMWVIAGTVYLGAFAFLFAAALARSPRKLRAIGSP